MAQFGPSLQTSEIATGNMRTTVDPFVPATGYLSYLKDGARNALGQAYFDNTKTLANPDGAWGKYRYVRYRSTANAAVPGGPGVVYWVDPTCTTVTSSYTEAATAGLNSIAGLLLPNTTDMPQLTAATLNGNFVWICVGGLVTRAVAATGGLADDILIGSTTPWIPGRTASGTPVPNDPLGTAVTAAVGGFQDVWVSIRGEG
jgi:hypothetical protein